MSQIDVSVLVPSYNHERFVEKAVASALASDVRLEVVIVDDGSTDGSLEVVRRLARDPRVRVFDQENRGAHAALNRCLEHARGELLFILNSDDTFRPQRIERLAAELQEHPEAALAGSWLRIIDDDGNEIGIKKGWTNLPPWPAPTAGPFLSDFGDTVLAMLETNYIATTSNMAFRRSLIHDHGLRFRNLRYAHDWEFILSACHVGNIRLIPEPLVDYRVHASNTIKEGEDSGTGQMRFEIQWVVARHARRILENSSARHVSSDTLMSRAWNSMPTFGCDGVLDRLLVLRGGTETPPPAFDAVLDEGHPFRRSAVTVLAEADGASVEHRPQR